VDERHQAQSIDVAKEVGVTVTFYDGYVAQFDLLGLRQRMPVCDAPQHA